MNTHNKLIPPFLRKLDHHLLLNNRLLWQTKIHFVLFYGVLAILGAMVFTWLYPLGTDKALPDEGTIASFITTITLILLCYWIYTQYQYSIEADFGEIKPVFAQYRLLIYTLVAMIFTAPILVTAFGLHYRKANIISLEELEADRKALDEGLVYFNDSGFSNFQEFLRCNSSKYSPTECTYQFNFFGHKTDFINSYGGYSYSLIEKAINNEELAFNRIEKYLELAQKYGFQLSEELTTEFIWQKFKGEGYLFTYDENSRLQNGIQAQLESLESTHNQIFNRSNVNKFWLCVSFSLILFGVLVQLLVIARLKYLILSIVSFVLLGIVVVLSIELIKELVNISIARYIIFSFVFMLFLMASSYGFKKRQSVFTHISLGMAHIFAPFSMFWVVTALISWKVINGAVLKTNLSVSIYLILSVVFYIAVLSRIFYKKHIQLNGLPK